MISRKSAVLMTSAAITALCIGMNQRPRPEGAHHADRRQRRRRPGHDQLASSSSTIVNQSSQGRDHQLEHLLDRQRRQRRLQQRLRRHPLNRVLGNVPSVLDGSLTATGSLYLVNAAGVVVGNNGRIATGGSFIASTQDVSNADFMAGKSMTFKGGSPGHHRQLRQDRLARRATSR